MDDAPNGMWPHGRPYVGQVAERSRTVTREDIELFAQISGDRNPLHFDDEYAARTRFGGVVVQSGLITGILNWVCAEEIPGPGTVWIHTDWHLQAPVRPGDTITGRAEVLKVRDDKPITVVRTTVTRGDGVVSVDGTAVCYTFPQPDPLTADADAA